LIFQVSESIIGQLLPEEEGYDVIIGLILARSLRQEGGMLKAVNGGNWGSIFERQAI
jgi:hypothetical protein